MRLGVLGHHGVVGAAVRHGLERIGHQVAGYDPQAPATKFEDVLDTQIVFVCVPTPMGADGSCNSSVVESTIAKLATVGYAGIVAIKSTVPPGTTDRLADEYPHLRIAFVPEFLRERAAFVDFVENHDLCVIGVGPGAESTFATIKEAHGNLPRSVVKLSRVEAELCKYFGNVFNALRVVFANEFYEVTKALGADYTAIKGAMIKRSNIIDAYLDANDSFRGFGGVCLPKDTSAFAAVVRQLCPHLKLFETIVEENRKFRITVPEGMRE